MGIRIIVALIAGTLLAAVESYQSASSPLLAPFVAAVGIAISLIIGEVLLVGRIRQLWNSTWIFPLTTLVCSVLVLLMGKDFGLGEEIVHPELGSPLIVLRYEISISGFLLAIFSIVHWPGKYFDF